MLKAVVSLVLTLFPNAVVKDLVSLHGLSVIIGSGHRVLCAIISNLLDQ